MAVQFKQHRNMKLFDKNGNEINLNPAGVGSSSILRDGDGKIKQITVFMLGGEKHIFVGADAELLETKMNELGI